MWGTNIYAAPRNAREQVIAGMTMLGWGVHRLSEEAGVSVFDVMAHTNPNCYQHPRSYDRIAKALKRNGIDFLDGSVKVKLTQRDKDKVSALSYLQSFLNADPLR